MVRIEGKFDRKYLLVQIPTDPQGFFLLADNKSNGRVKSSNHQNKAYNSLKFIYFKSEDRPKTRRAGFTLIPSLSMR